MGDEWWHKIRVEKIKQVAVKGKLKKPIKYADESPPQYPDPQDEKGIPDSYELVIEKRGGLAVGTYRPEQK